MKILVVSDIHYAKNTFFDIFEKEKCDKVLFLGDGFQAIDEFKRLYPYTDVYKVRGNCDFCYDENLSLEIKIAGKNIFLTHGHQFEVKSGLDLLIANGKVRKADIVLFGHTHIQYANEDNGFLLLNPGSVASGYYAVIEISQDITYKLERI